jgi:serine/threonine-protein kinase
MPLDLPQTIGRYRIQAHVSSDAKDDVYVAFDPLIERPVAIKVFRFRTDDAAAIARVRDAFYREMPRTGALIHPNIVTLYDAGELPGALFIASEFVEGPSLAERLEASASLDLSMRVSMLAQMVDALEYARGLGTPHLTLKPASVYIGPDYTLKIGGFGVAAVLDALAAVSPGVSAPTSRYVAPERAEGHPGDPRSDVYSFAEVALDVLAGLEPPDPQAGWTAETVPALPVYLVDQGVDADRWRAVFQRALAVDSAARYDSVLTFKFELILLLGVTESDAHHSWETARALGQLSALGGEPAAARDDSVATMLEHVHRRAPSTERPVFPGEEPDTGATVLPGVETILPGVKTVRTRPAGKKE